MNELGIAHISRGIDCFPLSAREFRVRLRTAAGDFERVEIMYAINKYAWNTSTVCAPMHLWARDIKRDYYQIDIDGDDTRLAYLFVLYKGDKKWYFTEEGVSAVCDLDLAYCFHFQYPYVHACDVHDVVPWADTAVMYQIFPERFANGAGDKPYINAAWNSAPTPKCFMGGDLKGITDRLDYIADLGANALYLTPVHPSRTNHKYAVIDYEDVDAGFGGKGALKALISKAHAMGMRVILDGVFNHCALTFKPFVDARARGKASPYWDYFIVDGDQIDIERVNYLTFGFSGDMPKLNTGNPDVIRYFCDIGAMWVRDYGIDGWRLDVMDELSHDFLRAFRKAVKRANPSALILGETWHDPRAWLMGDQLDGVMNYGLTKALMDYLVSNTLDAGGMAARLNALYARTTAQAARMMLNLLGSHDTTRFLTLLKGDIRRMLIAYTIMFFYVGIPCVYYGDEIGMRGGYDPGCRGGFEWDARKWVTELRDLVKKLAHLRRSGLLAGDEIHISCAGGALIIERPKAVLFVNAQAESASFTHNGKARALDALSYTIET